MWGAVEGRARAAVEGEEDEEAAPEGSGIRRVAAAVLAKEGDQSRLVSSLPAPPPKAIICHGSPAAVPKWPSALPPTK